MSDDGASDASGEKGPQPQQQLTMLFNTADFRKYVSEDVENLCCIMVTSTLCEHCGVGKLKYPKIPRPLQDGEEPEEEGEDGDEEGEEEAEEEEAADTPATRSKFFREVKARLIETDKKLKQRRHVRFFHICACTEEESNTAPLLAKDINFSSGGRKPSAVEMREMQRLAHRDLLQLLHYLEVRSTPCMYFFVRGQPLRYSLMTDPSPANKVSAMGARDSIFVRGSNYVKWRKTFLNAVVVRNEVLKEYDEEQREKARQARKEARRLERAKRRARRKAEEAEEEEEGEDDEY